MANADDCENDYLRCKSMCFDQLVANLAAAEGDAQKIADATEMYKHCRSLCVAARQICGGVND